MIKKSAFKIGEKPPNPSKNCKRKPKSIFAPDSKKCAKFCRKNLNLEEKKPKNR